MNNYLKSIIIEPNIIDQEGQGIYQTGYYIDIVDEYSMVLRKEIDEDFEDTIIFDIPLNGGECLVLEGYDVLMDNESIAIQNEEFGLVADIPLVNEKLNRLEQLKRHVLTNNMPLEGNITDELIGQPFIKVTYWVLSDVRKEGGITKFKQIEERLGDLIDTGEDFYSINQILEILNVTDEEFLILYPTGKMPSSQVLYNYLKETI